MFVLLFKFSLVASTCLEIQCQDTFDPASRCIEVTETIKVSGCPPGMYCPSYSDISSYNQSLDFMDTYCEFSPYQEAVDLCQNSSFIKTQLPGDQCCINSNCLSNICSSLICQGLSAGSACSLSESCAPGLYCNTNNTCSPALNSGSKCSNDLQCMIGYGCNNGFCTQLWSVGYTDRAMDQKFCISNYQFRGYCDMIEIKLNATTSLSSPFQCNLEDTCSYYSAAFRLVMESSSCLCSGNPNATTGYCGLYINQVQGMFETLYQSLQYTSSQCNGPKAHTADPYDLWQCGSISSSVYENYVIMTNRYQNWNLYQSGVIDQCAGTITLFQVGFGGILSAGLWFMM